MIDLQTHIQQYKADTESVYNTWFVGAESRLKAFRAIRHGVKDTAHRIAQGTFGNDFKGSALEVVLSAITEQKQVFEGAAHPFYWKPKLRIPDIYENEVNQKLFGAFLSACLSANREDQVLGEISRLANAKIKGIGPAVASILYFLHPTFVPPFNTAILNGYNALFNARLKLGSWDSYLTMREAIIHINLAHRELLSKDLGAIAGLLYEIGMGRMVISGNVDAVLSDIQARAEQVARKRHQQVVNAQREESEHTEMQHMFIRIGRALQFDVHVARNDRHRSCSGDSFSQMTLPELPPLNGSMAVQDTVGLIDVLWIDRATHAIVAAFEVEKSTSIYSGILRMKDLVCGLAHESCHCYIAAPKSRAQEVMAQLARPSFNDQSGAIQFGYLQFDDLREHCNAICKFGRDHHALRKIALFGIQTGSTV
jgi:type II restriction enzyme